MFDYIDCEAPLPCPDGLTDVQENALRTFIYEDSFQTNSLDDNLDHYLIKKNGLLKQKIFYSQKTSFYQEISIDPVDKNITCYGIIKISEKEKYFIEYNLEFKNGIMTEAKILNWHEVKESK